jgi:hypothetical protein
MAETIERFSPLRASGATGSACTVSGPYRSNRNSNVVLFVLAGTKFPSDTDGANTNWALVSDSTTPRSNI